MFLKSMDRLHVGLLVLAALTGAAMMLHVTADVVMRAAFHKPLPAVGEVTASYYMVACAFLPWSWLAMRDDHIRADLFSRLMSDRVKAGSEYVIDLVTIGYVGLVCWQGYVGAMRNMRANELREIPGGYLLVWPARWLVPLAAGAMILAILVRMVRRWRGEFTNPMDGGSH